ncbi:MAG: sigma-54-dependent Fis family transcriptional regulator [Deltaproteobacteria bacterium]|jgi:DNA-binding NtrC family response regulator|nr:sigma-54-dependent Fis family transcriptional regulator [Deltaproteobacteria bacterium]MBT4643806.1 sigma-54-dependent Fis family transcriptional regulator [Deltaproteobacteria bacterium]MBT7155371.1 sigma-54-dependent Fis family transcriptional regulator [Deltaproteobacteria bacterium]
MRYPSNPILVVDDEPEILEGVEAQLLPSGLTNLRLCSDSTTVMSMLRQEAISLVLLDLCMPDISGEELLTLIHQEFPHIKIIIVTGSNDIKKAVKCIKAGAFDYLLKPVTTSRLVSVVKHAVELQEEQDEYRAFRNRILRDELNNSEAFSEIITRNKAMRSIFQYTETIAVSNKPVLITGPSGVGKGQIAKAIHTASGRQGPFVSVNIAGLDDNLFSDTLYGHVIGAYTGADKPRSGLVEKARSGTLFLDEIGDLNMASQIKLLRLLEEGEYFAIGSDAAREADVRVVTATNRDLKALQKSEIFRTDLYYRVQTHHIQLPPLRERLDDLPVLVNHFLAEAAGALNKKTPVPPKELLALLSSYSFPGNIRELQSMIFDAVSHHRSKMLSMDRFKNHIGEQTCSASESISIQADTDTIFSGFDQLPTLQEARKQLISEALNRSQENLAAAAQVLGLSKSGLNKVLLREKS